MRFCNGQLLDRAGRWLQFPSVPSPQGNGRILAEGKKDWYRSKQLMRAITWFPFENKTVVRNTSNNFLQTGSSVKLFYLRVQWHAACQSGAHFSKQTITFYSLLPDAWSPPLFPHWILSGFILRSPSATRCPNYLTSLFLWILIYFPILSSPVFPEIQIAC